MLRSRYLRPGIVTNEVLAGLGPLATLMFERLMMLADREGRLEYRPARIHAQLFPYWHDLPVENLIEELAKAGFLLIYDGQHGTAIVAITNFAKYQHPHPHESQSVLAPPPLYNGSAATSNYMSRHEITSNDMSLNDIACKPRTRTRTNTEEYGVGRGGGVGEEVSTPPQKPPTRQADKPVKPKDPPPRKLPSGAPIPEPTTGLEIATTGVVALLERLEGSGSPPGPVRSLTATKNGQEHPSDETSPPAVWRPHLTNWPEPVPEPPPDPEPADPFPVLRKAMDDLAQALHKEPPDDDLVRHLAIVGGGKVGANAIGEALVRCYKAGKFERMRGWGKVLHIIRGEFDSP